MAWMRSVLLLVWFLVAVSHLAVVGCCQKKGEVELELVRTTGLDDGTIMAAAFDPSGKLLAMANDLGQLRVLDMPAQTVRWQEEPSDHWIGDLVFSPDGARLACRGRHLTVHDAHTGAEQFRVEHVGPSGFAWAPDGARFAYANRQSVILQDGDVGKPWAWFASPVNDLSFASDGALMVGDNGGRSWRVPASGGKPELRFDHCKNDSDNASSIAVVCAGGEVFDLASQGDLRCGDGTYAVPGSCFAFAVTADGRSFAVGGAEKLVRWWTDGGKQFRDIAVAGEVAALAFHPDGETLFLSTYSGGRSLHRAGKPPVDVVGMPACIKDVAMSPDGTMLAVKTQGWTLHRIAALAVQPMPNAISVKAGRRGSEFLVQERSRLVVLDGRSNTEVAAFSQRASSFSQFAAGPGNMLFVDGSLVNLKGQKVLAVHSDVLMHNYVTVALASDGSWAAGGVAGIEGDCGGLVLTNGSGKLRGSLDNGPVYTMAFSPDCARLYYGCGSGMSFGMGPTARSLRVIDAQTLEPIDRVDVSVSSWRFLDELRALVCSNGKLQVWDAARLKVLQQVPLDVPCHGFELSADRRTLVLSQSRGVRVYRVHSN
jgi:WD40 repeat protein